MRTIIINTLGSELRQNQLFYLPFQAERFHWIEKDLQDLKECPQQIAAYQSQQQQRQEYHLILLVGLAQLRSVELCSIRDVVKKLLGAYINKDLLMPLCQEQQLPPVGVSVVYMLKEMFDGEGDVEVDRELDRLFGFDEQMQQIPALTLKDKNGNPVLDVTELFADAIDSYNVSRENQKQDQLITENYALEQLRRNIHERLKAHRGCLYTPVGKERTVELNCQTLEFAPLTTDWELCCLDIQLNLSEHLQTNLDSGDVWKLELVPHETNVLQERIRLALQRVNYLQEHAPQLAFYEAEENALGAPKEDISLDIWGKLLEQTQIPGVEEARQAAQLDQEEREAAVQKETESLGKKLRHAWLLVGLEKKRFDGLYDTLQQQYEPEAAAKQQRSVLDICADVFLGWRRQVLSRKESFPMYAKAAQMPDFDQVAYENQLGQAQQKWGEAAVEQLEDYTDVREEAEKVKANFRKAYRLWPDGQFNATSKFCVYSAVLAALFLLQMLIPYMGITMGSDGVQLSRYVHFTLSFVMFISLYALGVLIWMRTLCRQLHKYTVQMHALLQQSHFRRRESIINAVASYGSVLPQCTLCYEKLQYLRQIHEENLQRKERYNSHMQLLSKAEELLYELCTRLRLSAARGSEMVKVNGGINFELPPSHPENVPYYVFMSEKWGRG